MEQERQKFPHRLPSTSSAKRTREDEDNPRESEEANAADHQLSPRAQEVDEPREQDHYLPIANITRIMRQILPPHAKIADDAKETVQESTSEYISFITQEANDRCQREKRKTVTAEDLIFALSKLGFEHYVEPLSLYLQKYREIETDRTSLRGELPAHLRRGTSSGPSDAGPLQVNEPNVNVMMNVGFGGGGSAALGGLYGGNSGQAVAGPSGGASAPRGPSGSAMQPGQSSDRGRTTRPSPLSRGGLLGPSGGAIIPGGPSGGAFGPAGMSVGPVAPSRYVMPGGTSTTGAATATDSWYNFGSMSEGRSSSSQATMSDFDHFLEFK